jgi:hypothetical protein
MLRSLFPAIFSGFGMLYQETSGNPAQVTWYRIFCRKTLEFPWKGRAQKMSISSTLFRRKTTEFKGLMITKCRSCSSGVVSTYLFGVVAITFPNR